MDFLLTVCLFVAFCAEIVNLATAYSPFQDRQIGCFDTAWSSYDQPMGAGSFMTRLTLETCRWHCEQQTRTFFAVRASNDCYCGDRFNENRRLNERNCFMHCAGDVGQICGGPLALRIHWVCPIGYYGPQCRGRCSNCGVNAELGSGCYFNGTCTGGCQDGWDGPKCDINLGPVLVVRPPATNSYNSSRDGSFVWTCMVANTAENTTCTNMKWYSPNGVEITSYSTESRVYIEADGRSSMKLHVLQSYDWSANERYSCRANVSGLVQQKDVAVNVRPFITKATMSGSVTEGGSVTLSCEAQGLPKPQYRFYKGSTSNPPLKSSNQIVVGGRAGLLMLQAARMEDEGYYTCKAFNDIGFDTKEGRISVWSKPSGCSLNNGGCSHYCTYHDPVVQCDCQSGHELLIDGKTCQVEQHQFTTSVRTVVIITAIIAGLVLLWIMFAACKTCGRKNRPNPQPTAPPADTLPRGRVNETTALSQRGEQQQLPTSANVARTRVREEPAINPDFTGAERPVEAETLIPSAPDAPPPSYEELYGDTRNKVAPFPGIRLVHY